MLIFLSSFTCLLGFDSLIHTLNPQEWSSFGFFYLAGVALQRFSLSDCSFAHELTFYLIDLYWFVFHF